MDEGGKGEREGETKGIRRQKLGQGKRRREEDESKEGREEKRNGGREEEGRRKRGRNWTKKRRKGIFWMGGRQDWLPVSSAAALAVDWNGVVLNQMLHTLLTFLRRGEEREDRGKTERKK